MTQAEFDYLASHLSPETEMLEYGSGHSTPNFAPLVKSLTTVDHHPEWYEKVKGMCSDRNNVEHVLVPMNTDRLDLIPEDWKKQPEAKYGFPTPWEFIDGRARQWVGSFVMNNLHENSIVFVHDYPERERYFTLENSYDKIEVVDTLVKFKAKV